MSKTDMICGNCGSDGHISRNCDEPLTSYGIICYKELDNVNDSFEMDENYHIKAKTREYKIILVQRSHTIGYIEFLRGKYDVTDEAYIIQLFEMMSTEEKGRILEYQNFDTLRNILGMSKKSSIYKSEYEDAKEKFNNLVASGLLHVLLKMSRNIWDSPEWGIPKGRRQHHESDLICGIREFYEETGLTSDDIQIQMNIQPLEEIYTGINNVVYRHIYFFAKFVSKTDLKEIPVIKAQTDEIRAVSWIKYDEIDNYIRNYHKEKVTIIKQAFNMLRNSNYFYELVM
jgi:8-oxo-dGTP pyrophosphatase MutT (NUDIX family)